MAYKNPTDRNAYARAWYARNKEQHQALVAKNNAQKREWWPQFKSTLACVRCGESHPACLDFHHRDPAEKEMAVHQAVRRRLGRERILAEVAKCDVLCANCHRKHHANELMAEAPS